MKHVALSAVALTLTLLLSACGGNGNSRIDQGSGADTSRLTPADVKNHVNQVSAAANTLLMTDLVATSRSAVHANTRGLTRCRGTGCESEPAYEEPAWSVNELAAMFSDASLRVDAPLHGVSTGVLTGRTSSVELDEGRNFTTDYTVYGGWLDQNFFGVKQTRYQGRSVYGSVEGLEDLIAFSGGTASGSNPMTGSAEWTGAVIAVDATAPTQPVNGQVTMTYAFSEPYLDVALTNLRGPRSYPDLQWDNLEVFQGRFGRTGGDGFISGTFYGPGHEEVGGIFERNEMIGAFGASRQ